MHRSIRVLQTAAAIAFAVSPALADELRSVAVVASASDFATPEARAALDQRIDSAADELCGVNAMAEQASWGSIKQCHAQVRADVYGKLTPLFQQKRVRLSVR